MLFLRVPSKPHRVEPVVPRQKWFTMLGTFFPHATWLVQVTAASRRSLARVSVPMWGAFLSEPLRIVALVGRCPAN